MGAMTRTIDLWIDGEWAGAVGGATRPVVNPATEVVESNLAIASVEDMLRAADAAEAAFPAWSRSSPLERSDILRRTAKLLRERANEIARDITLENGKTLTESLAEVSWAGEFLDWFAEEGRRTYGRIVPAKTPGVRQSVTREAIGPVLALSPWNWPLITAVKKISAALAAGCTVVLKPAEETPSGAVHLARAFADAGMPKGVFNLVFGDPDLISSTLIAAPQIKKVSFTGSVPVGRLLAERAARVLKPVTLELGGHAPVIIFEDADVEAAVAKLVPIKFRTCGQVCSSPTRFFVHASIEKRFVELLSAAAAGLKVGNGLDAATQVGPVVSARRLESVTRHVEDAVARGAKVATGGRRIGDTGFFYAPTILTDVSDDAAIMTEEPFGPIVPVTSFSTYEEVVRRANAVDLGLAAYAFTRSLETAQNISRDLECGVVGINTLAVSTVEAPFGGVKDSGGGKEGGTEGIDTYLKTKFIVESVA